MKKIIVVEENVFLGAGESSDCLVVKAGAAYDGRVIDRAVAVTFSFPFQIKEAQSAFSFPALGSRDPLYGAVPFFTLTPEMILKDAELIGAFISDGTLFAKVRFNSGITLYKQNELLRVQFLTDTIQFKAVGKYKPSKKGKKL